MAAQYVVVTELEFDNLLKADKGWSKDVIGHKAMEYVYSYRTKKNPDIVIKVYSSVTKGGTGRKCGGDAIRICAVNTKTDKGVLKTKRVNRTPGWDERVKERVLDMIGQLW